MATPGGGTRTVIVQKMPPGVQGIVTSSPTKTITLQNPLGAQAPPQGAIRLQSPAALGLPIAGSNTVTGAPRIIVSSAPGQYLYPLGNRLQPGAIATTMIRLATTVSSPLNTMAPQAVAGTSGLGVRLASPASLLAPVPNLAMMSPQARLATPPPGMASPVRPTLPGQGMPMTPGTPGTPTLRGATPGSPMRGATPGSPMRGRGGPRPRGMVRMRGGPPGVRSPGMRPSMRPGMRPGGPGPRGMRPRGIGPRGMRPGGPRGPRPGGPRAPPPPPEANEIKVTKDTSKGHVKKETPECIDLG